MLTRFCLVPLETVMSVSANVPVSMASPKSTLTATGSALVGLVSEDARTGVGAPVSTTSVWAPEAGDRLPAASVWVALSAWVPSASVLVSVIDQAPPVTLAVGASAPSRSDVSVIVPPSSLAVPEITGVVSFVGEAGAVTTGAAGAVRSIVRLTVFETRLFVPATSVSTSAAIETVSAAPSVGEATSNVKF